MPVEPNHSKETHMRKSLQTGLRVNPSHTPANSGSSDGSLQASPSGQLHPAPSPIVKVSSYNRGDSPARPPFPMARSSSKRSRASQSSNLLVPANQFESDDENEEKQQPSEQRPAALIARRADGSWLPSSESGQTGIDPTDRADVYVPSLKEIEEKSLLDEKNAEITSWLEKSEAGSDAGAEGDTTSKSRGRRLSRPKPRAHSTGARVDAARLGIFNDSVIPGPGALIDEDSEDDYTTDSASHDSAISRSRSPPATVDIQVHEEDQDYFPPVEDIPPDQEEPLPTQFFRARPWQDPLRAPMPDGTNNQPATSNAAIYKYDLQAAKFETASRAATWGTRRRLSETDIQSIISGQSIRKLSLAQKTRERGNSIVRSASKLIPRRSSSTSKKKDSDAQQDNLSSEPGQKRVGDALSSFKPLQRISSIGKGSKSPTLNTTSAFLAMTGQITAVGRSTSATPDTGGFPAGPFKALKRQRSKSELPRTRPAATPQLSEFMTNHGAPPIPTVASPNQESAPVEVLSHERVAGGDVGQEDEEDDAMLDQGVKIDLKVRIDNIVPNIDGFRTHARQLNPRLEPFLAERIVQEQVRRYKKLVENKVKHTHAVKNLKQCSSHVFCFELGGEAKPLPPRMSTKDPDATCGQYQVAENGDSEGEVNSFPEGVVTAALFPPGIPLPPVKRLPAEFECSLCFKVKKFHKPSDWTKHVHEDVQPFTCTFPVCAEARSFKRKADWVRHENERHRHLEWWQCNLPECNHICYRKDNFVQHLVREHKKREPKVKSRGSTSSKVKPDSDPMAKWQAQVEDEEIQEVWKLVEMCHSETRKRPRDEVCKFCGNVCNSWKKLTVHLAKHMEQIAMPVLELVRRREVSPDTIISPVERNNRQQQIPHSTSPGGNMKTEPNGHSPYVMNVTPHHQGLQAVHSPGTYSQDSRYTHSMQNSPSFTHTPTSSYDPHAVLQPPDMNQFAQMHNLPANMSYGPYQGVRQASSFIPINTPVTAASTYPPLFNSVRRSPQPVSQNRLRSQPPYLQGNSVYDVQAQPHMYSSPTDSGPYPAQFELSMDSMQQYTSNGMGYEANGMTTSMPMPQGPIYDPDQGSPFDPTPSNGRGYSYPPQ
jgi:hypothetical protein